MSLESIMIIDDSNAEHFLVQEEIKSHDPTIEIISVYDGQEALSTLKDMGNDQPSAILVDINMPGMNGFEFLERYSNFNNKSNLVMMISSSMAETDINTLKGYPFVKTYCVKPFKMDKILNHL